MCDHFFHYLIFFQYDLFLFDENKKDDKQKCSALDIDESRRLFPNTFVYSCFSPKIQFLFCLLSSVAPWGDLMVGNTMHFNVL